MTRLAVFISTFGYIGLFPVAPGTVGSLGGLVVYAILEGLAAPLGVRAAVIAVVFAIGVWSATVAERHFGGVDPGAIVVDEVAGMLITLFLVPVSLTGAVAGFLLFRVFDIIKPFPARRLERLHGGLGVMCDDAMAAVYANLCLRGLWWIAGEWIV
jgi:phosphatidylglycerophosphatase A